MPRFAVVAVLLLAAMMAAGAATLWYGGWVPDLRVPEAAPAPSAAQPPGQLDPVARAALAIRAHDVAAVRQYLAAAGDPDGADAEGEILLNKAVLHGTPEIVDVLLEAGADPNLPGRNGLGPLAIAALAGRHAMLDRLMQANAADATAGAVGGAEQPLAAQARRASTAAAGSAAAAPPPASHGRQPENPRTATGVAAAAPALAAGGLTVDGSASLTGDGSASLTGDRSAQPPLPAEPYVTMTGLLVNPIARPAAGAPVAAHPAGSLTEPASEAFPATANASATAGPAAAAGAGAAAGDAPQAWVSAAQRRLGQLGYYRGPITGFAGPLTADAVKRYQAVAGIPRDGIVSVDLLRRIGASVEAPRPASPTVSATSPPAPAAQPAPGGMAPGTPAQGGQRPGGEPGATAGAQRARPGVQQRGAPGRSASALPSERQRLGLRRSHWTVAVLPRRHRLAAPLARPAKRSLRPPSSSCWILATRLP